MSNTQTQIESGATAEINAALHQYGREMLTLRWPEYAEPDTVYYLAAERAAQLHEVSYPYGQNFEHPLVFSLEETWDSNPYYLREREVEYDANQCRILADMVCDTAFAACNQPVARAIKAGLHEAIDQLGVAFQTENDVQGYIENPSFEYPAAFSLQALKFMLAAQAAQLGVLDYQEAFLASAESYRGVLAYAATQNGGQQNTYAVRCVDMIETPVADHAAPESPGTLTIQALPGQRVSFSLHFDSSVLRDKFSSTVTTPKGTHLYEDLSIRIDHDDLSPSGFSLDFGRDPRELSDLSRPGDVVGSTLARVRSQGSHFSEAFAGVTPEDMTMFIQGMATLLRADAEMARMDTTYSHQRMLNSEG